MNLIRELCDLYDKNIELVGKTTLGRYGETLILLPIFHTTVTAQITVTIDEEGNFLRAGLVPKEENQTVIPVTEKSGGRTSGLEPHPLCDTVQYLAGDYMQYVIPEKGKDYTHYYTSYMKELGKWAVSRMTHEKVIAVWQYLRKGELMKDLVTHGVLKIDEQGNVSSNEKIQIVEQTKAFVRFRIEKEWDASEHILDAEPGTKVSECWMDRSLQDAYIAYCRSIERQIGLSYLTGEETQISYSHPKKIRNEGDGAKLISANDDKNFTFLGRFISREEAFSIGYEDSQKAHNALKWIIRRQGRNWNGLTVVTWESDLKELPEWYHDTDDACEEFQKSQLYESCDGWGDEEEAEIGYEGTNPKEAARFQNAIAGYAKNLEFDSRMLLLAFDAATTGRLAIMECQSLTASVYLENLKSWHEACGWLHPKYKKGESYEYYGMTGMKDIASILYGVESVEGLVLKGSNEKMYAQVCKRLIPCVFNGQSVPEDMVRLAVQRASAPVSYEKPYNWRRTLALACSFVKKKYIESGSKEEWTVALNENSQDRDYLYGRLLAVADRAEYRTFEKEESRETNAKRHMNAFSQQPYRTWKVIEERLEPYLYKLSVGERLRYEHLIEQICWQFKDGEFEKNDALNGLYLLGFHNQGYALRKYTQEDQS